MSEKTFDLSLEKYSLPILKNVLSKILAIFATREVVERLPNEGNNLYTFKVKLENEIGLREGLNRTKARVEELSVKCASDTDVGCGYGARLGSLDRRPIVHLPPILPIRIGPSGRTESMSAIPDEEKEMAAQSNHLRAVECHLVGRLDSQLESMEFSSSSSSTTSSDSNPPEFFHLLPAPEFEIFQEIMDSDDLEKAVKNYVFSKLTLENQYDINEDQLYPSGAPVTPELQDEAAALLPNESEAAMAEQENDEGPKQEDEAESSAKASGSKHPTTPEDQGGAEKEAASGDAEKEAALGDAEKEAALGDAEKEAALGDAEKEAASGDAEKEAASGDAENEAASAKDNE